MCFFAFQLLQLKLLYVLYTINSQYIDLQNDKYHASTKQLPVYIYKYLNGKKVNLNSNL